MTIRSSDFMTDIYKNVTDIPRYIQWTRSFWNSNMNSLIFVFGLLVIAVRSGLEFILKNMCYLNRQSMLHLHLHRSWTWIGWKHQKRRQEQLRKNIPALMSRNWMLTQKQLYLNVCMFTLVLNETTRTLLNFLTAWVSTLTRRPWLS